MMKNEKAIELSTFKKRNSCRSDCTDPWIRGVFFLDAGFALQSGIAINDGNIQLFCQWHACCKHTVDKIAVAKCNIISNKINPKVDIFFTIITTRRKILNAFILHLNFSSFETYFSGMSQKNQRWR